MECTCHCQLACMELRFATGLVEAEIFGMFSPSFPSFEDCWSLIRPALGVTRPLLVALFAETCRRTSGQNATNEQILGLSS